MKEGISWIIRYVYGSFGMRVENVLVLYVIFCDWMYALNVLDLSFDLLGHFVMTHFERLRSISDHSVIFCSLIMWGWMCCILSDIMARSSAYAVVVHVDVDVFKWYPMLFFFSQRSRDYMNIINKYGLRVSPCMVPRLIVIGCIIP